MGLQADARMSSFLCCVTVCMCADIVTSALTYTHTHTHLYHHNSSITTNSIPTSTSTSTSADGDSDSDSGSDRSYRPQAHLYGKKAPPAKRVQEMQGRFMVHVFIYYMSTCLHVYMSICLYVYMYVCMLYEYVRLYIYVTDDRNLSFPIIQSKYLPALVYLCRC